MPLNFDVTVLQPGGFQVVTLGTPGPPGPGGTVAGVLASGGDYPAAALAAALGPRILPAYPSAGGAYTLTVTVTGGVGVLSWAAGGVSPPPPTASLNFSLAANSQYVGLIL